MQYPVPLRSCCFLPSMVGFYSSRWRLRDVPKPANGVIPYPAGGGNLVWNLVANLVEYNAGCAHNPRSQRSEVGGSVGRWVGRSVSCTLSTGALRKNAVSLQREQTPPVFEENTGGHGEGEGRVRPGGLRNIEHSTLNVERRSGGRGIMWTAAIYRRFAFGDWTPAAPPEPPKRR